MTVQDCLLTGNGVAAGAPSGTLRLSNNDLFDNGVDFQVGAGTLISAGNNHAAGNGTGATPTAAMTVR